MRTGLIGVGPWGRKMATAFQLIGSPVTDYSRSPFSPDLNVLGKRWKDWRYMIPEVDIVACAATPAITYEVMQECITRRKPVLLTKPLYLDSLPNQTISAPVMIDFVRLWSPQYQMIKKATATARVTAIDISFCGDGPVRSFPGLYDYGPHVFAWVFDLLSTQISPHASMTIDSVAVSSDGDLNKKLYVVCGYLGNVSLTLRFGNGEKKKTDNRRLFVRFAPTSYSQDAFGLYEETKDFTRGEVFGITGVRGDSLTTLASPEIGNDSPLTLLIDNFVTSSGFSTRKRRTRYDFGTLALSVRSHATLKQIAAIEEASRSP